MSATVSWITLGLGVSIALAGALWFPGKTNWAIFAILVFILLMQLSDGLTWTCGNPFASKLGYVANILQPIVIYAALSVVTEVPTWVKGIAAALVCIYVGTMFVEMPGGPSINSTPISASGHLNYSYWTVPAGIVYIITLVGIVLCLLRPLPLAGVFVGYILITLLISQAIYKDGSGPSMWCFFAVGLALILYAVQFSKIFRTK
jgi:hypothetical protein